MYDEVLRQLIIEINSLNHIAALYYQQGQYEQGINFAQQACDLIETYFDANYPGYGNTLNTLAVLYQAVGDLQKAQTLYRQCLKITKDKLGPDHPNYATTLNSLAGVCRDRGCYSEAESLYRQVKEIRRRQLGKNHPEYATTLNNLAELYYFMGRFTEAETLYQKALKIWEDKLGTDHADYPITLNNLALLYQNIGRFTEAETLYQKALEIWETALDTNHPYYATALNNLALLYRDMGYFTDAEPLLRQDLKITRTRLGKNHHHYANSLSSLAVLYHAMGRFTDAEPLLREALEIIRVQLGKNHPHYATILHNLAALYHAMGLSKETELLYQQTLEIREATLGTAHPSYANTLINSATLQAAVDRPQEALNQMQDAAKIENKILGQIFSISSDAQRLTYLQQNYSHLEVFLSLVTQYLPNAPNAVQAAFDLLLRRKALSAEAAAMQRSAILSGRYRHLAPQLEQLRQLDNQIASLAWNVPPPEQLAAYETQLATLYHQRDELDRSLSREIPEMNLQKQLDTANHRAIALTLPEGTTLVEFVRFNVANFKAILANGDSQWLPARYLAFILPAKEPEQVKMIDLGEAEAIDNLIRVFRKSVSGDRSLDLDSIPDEPEPIPPDVELRQKLIDPLKPYLKPQQQVFLAPDGELCCLPFGVLPTAEGGYLMEEYELCYLSVGRDLLRFAATQTLVQPTDSLVIADPDYNLSNSDLTPQPPSLQGKGEQEELPSPCRRGVGGEVRSDSAIYQQLHRNLGRGNGEVFKPIPATRIEGAQVAARLGVTPQMGTQALKSLVSRCQSPWILHIATHGYFLETRPETPPPQMMSSQRLHSAAQQNPLARSGLAFAGANTLLDGGNLPPEAEDGLLTAQGASGINLAATALVVASACQTALGDVQVGEGVLGLRRAFVLAGVQTLVMSLWSVPDVATAILMERFYHNLLTEKMGRAKALEQAQFYVRDLTIAQMRPQWLTPEAITRITDRNLDIGNQLRELIQKPENYRPYVHPRYWGAFICQGDASPLF
jgi:CHAT domain-containing protein/tetratricopeptide (TPR) repeat protein